MKTQAPKRQLFLGGARSGKSEGFHTQGRLTDALVEGKISDKFGLPAFNLEDDRFMICGSPSMLKDFTQILDERGFKETRRGVLGEYVIERAFVES